MPNIPIPKHANSRDELKALEDKYKKISISEESVIFSADEEEKTPKKPL